MDQWYVARGKVKKGPYSRAQLEKAASQGTLHPTDMLLQAGAWKWIAAGAVPGLFPASDVPPMAVPGTHAAAAAWRLPWRWVAAGGIGLCMVVIASALMIGRKSPPPKTVNAVAQNSGGERTSGQILVPQTRDLESKLSGDSSGKLSGDPRAATTDDRPPTAKVDGPKPLPPTRNLESKPSEDSPAPIPADMPLADKADAPKPLPDDIVKEWQKAGASVGWMRGNAFHRTTPPQAGDLPAFAFGGLKGEPLAKLPVPQAPFGLYLDISTKGQTVQKGGVTYLQPVSPSRPEVELKGLSRLKSLLALRIDSVLVTEVGFRELAGLESLQRLYLYGLQMTDANMEKLAGLKSLRTLDLSHTNPRDAGLRHLARLENLETLDLSGRYVGDRGMSHLASLKRMRTLNIQRTLVTDAGLKHLAAMKSLHTLDVAMCRVTDAGLKDLAGLVGNLQVLNLQGTQATGAGVAELLKALPGCHIDGLPPAFVSPPKESVKPIAILKGMPTGVAAVAFSADGSRLVAAGWGQDPSSVHSKFAQAIVWNVDKQAQVCVCRNPSRAISPLNRDPPVFWNAWLTADGRTVITRNELGFQVWDGTTGKERAAAIPVTTGEFTARALSPDGAYFAVAWNQRVGSPQPPISFRIGEIVIWDLNGPHVKWRLPGEMGQAPARSRESFVTKLAFSPDGSRLAVLSRGGLRIFALETGKDAPTLKASSDLKGSQPDDDLLADDKQAPTFLWLEDGLLFRTAPQTPGWLRDAATGAAKDRSALRPDGKWLKEAHLIGDIPRFRKKDDSPELVIWDIARGRAEASLKLANELFTANSSVRVQVTGPVFTAVSGGEYRMPKAVSANGKRVAIADRTGAVHVYDLAQIQANVTKPAPK